MRQSDQIELLSHWAKNAKRAQHSQYRMADRYRRRYTLIGTLITLISGICGSSVVAGAADGNRFGNTIKIIIGLCVLLCSGLSAIQTFLKLEERAEQHRAAGARYSSIKRHVDQMLASSKHEAATDAAVDALRRRLDSAGKKSPQVVDSLWTRIVQKMPVRSFKHYDIKRKPIAEIADDTPSK